MSGCNNPGENLHEKQPIGRLIYLTSLNLRNYAEKMLSPYDLTVEQFHLLKNTSVVNGFSQNQLCEFVGKKPANITRILDRLEKKQWIERRVHPTDRRSSLVFLTEEGEQMVDGVSKHFETYSSRFFEGVSGNEEQIFRDVLNKIDDNIKKLMNEIDKEEER
jgi:DNA-binding MarR family transcriptional regulator